MPATNELPRSPGRRGQRRDATASVGVSTVQQRVFRLSGCLCARQRSTGLAPVCRGGRAIGSGQCGARPADRRGCVPDRAQRYAVSRGLYGRASYARHRRPLRACAADVLGLMQRPQPQGRGPPPRASHAPDSQRRARSGHIALPGGLRAAGGRVRRHKRRGARRGDPELHEGLLSQHEVMSLAQQTPP